MPLRDLALLVAASATTAISGAIPLHFEPNQGQSDPAVQYVARIPGATILVKNDTILFNFGLSLEFAGTSGVTQWEAMESAQGTTSYRIGALRIEGVPHYSRIRRRNLYPGIDLVLHGSEGRLEYDFVVAPGADPRCIHLRFGRDAYAHLNTEGNLEIRNSHITIIEKRPTLFQRTEAGSTIHVAGGFRKLCGNMIAFSIGHYDRKLPLTIDPVLESSSLLGGSAADQVFGADSGIAIVGTTASPDFPGESLLQQHGKDVFIYYPSSQTTQIIGGSGDDIVSSVSMVPGGAILIGGYTNSPDFPVTDPTANIVNLPIQGAYGGGASDGFVIVVGTVSYYLAVTYFGGSGDDRVLAVGQNGTTYAFAGSTTSDDLPVIRAGQPNRGGGIDGFAGAFSGCCVSSLTPFSTYLGGSGDDIARAVAVSAQGEVYVGGGSASSDWNPPGFAESWNSPSMGFVARISSNGTNGGTSAIDAGTWMGGSSGKDRVTALAVLPDTRVAIAGATASTDFAPMGTPLPFAGGASDAFLVTASSNLQKIISAITIGGSGDDEALALAASPTGEIVMGGWTNSSDFPLANAFQSTFGGGASDGFLYYLDSANQTQLSTYFGGSGADRVNSVEFSPGQTINFGGATDSYDLPLVGAQQASEAGGTDGFYGSFSAAIIHAGNMVVGKDLAATGFARLGDPQNYIGVPLTVTTADATHVLLGLSGDDPGQSSITIAVRSGTDIAGRSFGVYCLVDSGVTALTLSAPGYPTRTIEVRCVPVVIQAVQTSTMIQVAPAAWDAAAQRVIATQGSRPGTSINITAASSNPQILQLTSSTPALGSNGYGFSWKAIGTGTVTVTLSSDSGLPFTPTNQFQINAEAVPLGLFVPMLARDFSAPIRAYGNGAAVTYTSSDPSRVLLHASGGTPQAQVTSSGTVYADALASSGNVTITATTAAGNIEQATVNWGIGGLVITDSSGDLLTRYLNGPATTVNPGAQTFNIHMYVNSPANVANLRNPYAGGFDYGLRLGADPVSMNVTSSDPTILAPPATGTQPSGAITVQALNAGTATLMPASSRPELFSLLLPLSLTVQAPNSFQVTSLTVGKNLQTQLCGANNVTLTSSDPSLLLISNDPTQTGSASIVSGSSCPWVQALADSGDVTVTASASSSATIHLAPSGFRWHDSKITVVPGGSQREEIDAVVLDPATLVPVAIESPNPNLAGSIGVQSSDATLASALTTSQSGQPINATINGLNPGDATLTIVQPAGFITPATAQPLKVHVSYGALQLGIPTALGINLQTPINPGNLLAASLTSGNPSVLAVSGSRADVGGASATTPAYLQALAGPADVLVTATAPGYDTTSSIVQTTPSAIGFVYSPQYGTLQLTTGSAAQNIQVGAFAVAGYNPYVGLNGTTAELRAGLDPIQIQIDNSNPAVAAIAAPVRLDPLTNSTLMQLNPIGPGATTLSIVPPPGFASAPAPANALNVTVALPAAFTVPNVSIGKDVQTSFVLSSNTVSTVTADTDFTVTSGDPSKLLLSLDGQSLGSASVTVHFAAGAQGRQSIFLQALDSSGTVTVTTTGAGYAPSTATVTLTAASLALNNVAGSTQSGYLNVAVGANQQVQISLNPPGSTLRPGAAPVNITASVNNSSIFSISPAQATIGPAVTSVTFMAMGLAPGSAVATFSAANYPSVTVNVTVQGTTGSISAVSPLGKDLQETATVLLNGLGTSAVTLTTSDPTRLLISASATGEGGTAASFVPTGSTVQFYLQALANSGSVQITATVAGLTVAQASVTLAQPTVYLSSGTSGNPPISVSTLSAPIQLAAAFTTGQTLRPGASPVTVSVSSSDSTVGSLSATQLLFSPVDVKEPFTFQPLAAGTTLVSLSVPAGFADPLGGRQQLITVTPVRLGFSASLTAPYDLVKPFTMTIGQAPASQLTVTLTSSDPTSLLLSNSNETASPSITTTFRAGGTTSDSFNLIALAASGSVTLTASAPPLGSQNFTVTLATSGFGFSTGPATLATGQVTGVPIMASELAPVSLAPLASYALMPGAPAVAIAVASSNPSILSVVSSPVSFFGGDSRETVAVSGQSHGAATLQITQPAGFSAPSSGTTYSLTVQ